MFRRVFKALTYPEFRLWWLGACASSIGTWVQKGAQNWLVFDMTHSKTIQSFDAFLGEIPIVLFSLFGGVASDRFDRRKILIGSQIGQMTCALLLALLFFTGSQAVWHILLLSFLTGFSQAFGGPANQSLLPMMVPKEGIQNAIAMNSLQFNVARFIGPAVGIIALERLGPGWCFTMNGLSFLAVIAALLMISAKHGGSTSQESVLASIRTGIQFIRSQPGLDNLIVLAFCMTALSLPVMTFLPAITQEVFGRQAELYAKFMTISGAGAICGALIVAATGNVKNKGRVALANLIAVGALLMVFALSRNVWLSYAALFFFSGSMMCVFAFLMSLVQNLATNEMRGRVMSVYNVAFRGGGPAGVLIAGILSDLTSVPAVLFVSGSLLALLGAYFLFVERRVAAL